ncbi:hypothetical protein EBU94_01285, partial [bacterium]|nr:hypothetical protein [bacterium]
MAGLPHYRNSRAAMNKFEPVYLSQFEIQLTPPPAVASWTLVMENVLKVSGVDINKLPAVVEQKYKSAKRTFAGGMNDATVADVQLEFEVNLDDANSMYVYKALRQWTDLIYDPLTGRMGLKKDYTGGPMIINYFNKNGDIFRQVKFPVCFPTTPLPVIESDFSSNEIYKVAGFTFRCDY